MNRGTFSFDVTDKGDLIDGAANVDALRRLWLDRTMIDGSDLGPGNSGDFDFGAWHVGCHIVAAGGVRRASNGQLLWLAISHATQRDDYFASVTSETSSGTRTYQIASPEGRALLIGSTLLGFVEGTSIGHISARGVRDAASRFNGWPRQDFDRPATSNEDGGTVWEHWCTLRDIRETDAIGTSVLRAYVSLVAALGDLFAPTVARGRRDYGHPKQLCALVKAGFTSKQSATWDVSPAVIPAAAEKRLLEARAVDSLAATKELSWGDTPRYYMFARRIARWSPAREVSRDLQGFGIG
jgi:hypothetical protein